MVAAHASGGVGQMLKPLGAWSSSQLWRLLLVGKLNLEFGDVLLSKVQGARFRLKYGGRSAC